MSHLAELPTPVIEGVQIPRRPLDAEVERQIQMAKALSQHALDKLADGGRLDEGEADDLLAIAKCADVAWSICRGLLAEQRERAKLKLKHPEAGMTDEEFADYLRTLVRRLTPDQLDEMYLGSAH